MKKKVLVARATGNLGGRIVNGLLVNGAHIRVLIRPFTDPEKLKSLKTKV